MKSTGLLAGWVPIFLPHPWCCSPGQPPRPRDRQVTMVFEESLVSFFSPPFSLLLKSVWVASWRHYSLFSPSTSSMCSFLPGSSWADNAKHWRSFSRCLLTGCHWLCLWLPTFLDNFPTVVWLGLATCWWRTSERILSVGSLHAHVFCFTLFHQVLGWSSCLALSNQQACVRPCCFTGRPRPLGTGFFNGSMVLSIDLLLPPLRFLTYGFLATGSPRLTAF